MFWMHSFNFLSVIPFLLFLRLSSYNLLINGWSIATQIPYCHPP